MKKIQDLARVLPLLFNLQHGKIGKTNKKFLNDKEFAKIFERLVSYNLCDYPFQQFLSNLHPMSHMKRIDCNLQNYYKLCGKEYNSEFIGFCEDAGFCRDDEIEKELEQDYHSCMLLDFDEREFPYLDKSDDDNKAVIKLELLRQFKDREIPFL